MNTLEEVNAKGNSIINKYDKLGNLIQVADKKKNYILKKYEYDVYMRLLNEMQGSRTKISYEYDRYDRVEKKTANEIVNGVNKNLYTEEYFYSNSLETSGNRTERKTIKGNGGNSPDIVIEADYDKLGRVTKENNDGIIKRYSYDFIGNKITGSSIGNDRKPFMTTYTYDCLGRLLTETDGYGNRILREYDLAGRKIKETDKNGGVSEYTYNDNGQITIHTSMFKSTAIKSTKWNTYDRNGNLIKEEISSSLPGAALTKKATEYKYNNMNRMIENSVTEKD